VYAELAFVLSREALQTAECDLAIDLEIQVIIPM